MRPTWPDGKLIFGDVHIPEGTIVIGLHDERYGQLIGEVADPIGTVSQLHTAPSGEHTNVPA